MLQLVKVEIIMLKVFYYSPLVVGQQHIEDGQVFN